MTSTRYRSPRWRREWSLVSAALVLIAVLLGCSGLTGSADLTLYDGALSLWQRPTPKDIVIVAIDDASLQAIGRWPWRRAVHATVLKRIAEARPKAILFNVLLSEPDADRAQDAALAEALARAERVVLPVGLSQGPAGGIRELLPLSPFAEHATLAHADAAPDADGVLRRADLLAGEGQTQRPHMAVALLHVAGQTLTLPHVTSAPPTGARSQQGIWHRSERVAIRYLGPPGSIETVSYSDVLSGRVPADRLSNRFVLIGATAPGLGDSFQTPVSAHVGPMPSVEVTAQLLDMLRSDATIRWAPPLAAGLGAASLVLMLMAAYWSLSPRQALITTSLIIVSLPVLSTLGVRAGLWFPPGSLMIMAALSYPIWSWRRLETASDLLTQALHQFHATPGVIAPVSTASTQADDQDYLDRQIGSIQNATRQLQDARRLVADTLDSLPCAVLVLDPAGRILQTNAQVDKLMRMAAQTAATGQQASTLLAPWTPNNAPHWSMLLERAREGRTAIQSEVQGPSGDQHLVSIVPMLDEQQVPQALIACLTDITALRRVEQHRAELLGFIAHDIRSPQASLVSLVQLQRLQPQGMSPSEVLDHVDRLAHSTLNLCEELLQIMRSESRPLRREPLDLLEVIRQTCLDAAPQAQAKHIALTCDGPSGQTARLMGDAPQLQRALMNLLSNAIKFSPEHTTVTIRLRPQGDQWILSVSDQGPGIPASEISRLFRRYERIDSDEHLRLAPGIGLGLVFVETVIKRHGGHIRVRSETGRGTTFECDLPVGSETA